MVQWGTSAGVLFGLVVLVLRGVLVPLFTDDVAVRSLAGDVLLVVAVLQPINAIVFVLDGVLIGAGDGRYLAAAGVVTVVAYAPVALLALTAAEGRQGLTWLWIAFTVVFMGARAVTLGLRARGDRWLRLGG